MKSFLKRKKFPHKNTKIILAIEKFPHSSNVTCYNNYFSYLASGRIQLISTFSCSNNYHGRLFLEGWFTLSWSRALNEVSSIPAEYI